MTAGIYKLENLVNGHCYIGQSVNLKRREKEHYRRLKRGEYCNPYLNNAYKKYGEENFIFTPLLYCEPFELTRYEQLCVDTFNPEYNLRKECVDSNKGTKRSEESIQNTRLVNIGRVHTEEARHNMSLAHIGKKQSKEAIRKTTLANIGNTYSLGYKHSEETKKKMSLASTGRPSFWTGKKLPEETRQKMSLAHKNISDETRHKMSLAQTGNTKCLGKKLSEETRLKISLSQKARLEHKREETE